MLFSCSIVHSLPLERSHSPSRPNSGLSGSNQIVTCSLKHTHTLHQKEERKKQVSSLWSFVGCFYCWTFWTRVLKILCTTTWNTAYYCAIDKCSSTQTETWNAAKFTLHLPQISLELCTGRDTRMRVYVYGCVCFYGYSPYILHVMKRSQKNVYFTALAHCTQMHRVLVYFFQQ